MLGVGFPVHVEGELHERVEALLARAACALDTAAPRTELAQQQAQSDED